MAGGPTLSTCYTYDAARRLTDETRPELNGSAKRHIDYNLASDPTTIQVYRDSTLRYRVYADYDELSRVRARRGNNGQNVRYAYDGNDNLKTITDSLNRATTLTYDALNRLSTRNFNYEATGSAAGFSSQFLLRAAGYAQISAGTSTAAWALPFGPLGGAPYGDDSADQQNIMAGIDYYNCLASGGE